jgi:signal transduction histidine kinase/ligand-binding sensor domain-containing protein
MIARSVLAQVACLLSSLGGPAWCAASEAPPADSIRDFRHTAWTLKDGAPAEIWSIAQTVDGWLWLGTPTGLFRFDGVHFARHDLLPPGSAASRAARHLLATRDGALWVAYLSGGGTVLAADGTARELTEGGLPATLQIDALREDCLGRTWVTTARGLFYFEHNRWNRADAQPGWPAGATEEPACDRAGARWVPAGEAMYVERDAAKGYEPANISAPKDSELVPTPKGELWIAGHEGFAPFAGDGTTQALPEGPLRRSSRSYPWMFARDGSYWSVYCSVSGVCRNAASNIAGKPFRWKDPMDAYRAADGLSSDNAMTLLEDSEGNVWVGTKRGLDRFTHQDVSVVRFPEPVIYFAMVPDANGVIWSGTSSRSEAEDRWWHLDPKPTAIEGFTGDVTAAYRDADRSILFGGRDGFWRFANGKFEQQAIPPAEKGKPIQSIVRDAKGRLWVAFRSSPPYRVEGDKWLPSGDLFELPDLPLTLMTIDAAGQLWFAFAANRLAIFDGTRLRQYAEADGLRTGTVTALLPGEISLVGGELGLAVFDGERFRLLRATRADVLTGITGLVRTKDGSLWINGSAGAVHITAKNLARALAEPAFETPYEVFNTDDGMPGSAQQTRPLPSLVEGSDGKLWFATSDGLAYIDPTRIWHNATPPPVVIRGLGAGDMHYPANSPLDLPPRTRALRVDYSALSFVHPERITFRYRLEGLDDDWQEAGTRREAYYTNLRAGNYVFRVIAANEDGVWNERGASIAFTIAPTFSETRAFDILGVIAAALVLWALYALRFWQVSRRLQMRLEERHAERERIARELHDTLLQSMQALILTFQVEADRFPDEDPARRRIDRTIDRAISVLSEGRDRVTQLRDTSENIRDLAAAYAGVARDYGAYGGPSFRLIVDGEPRPLDPIVADELYRIGHEAIANAFVHAHAKEIDVEVIYGPNALRVAFRDDGRGIDAAVRDAGGRSGHWGLKGMRERADKLGARLEVMSSDVAGTTITITVRAKRAYVRKSGALRRALGRLRSKGPRASAS